MSASEEDYKRHMEEMGQGSGNEDLLAQLRVQAANLEREIAQLVAMAEHEEHDKTAENETIEFVNTINRLGLEFDKLCIERHEMGQQEYGKFTFLGNDVVRMMLEELADTANYCRYQSVKLLLLQHALERHIDSSGMVAEGEQEITIGVGAFKGVGDVGWKPS